MASPERNLAPEEVTRLLARDGNDIAALYELVAELRADVTAGFDASAMRDAELGRASAERDAELGRASAERDAELGRKLDLILARLGDR